MHRNVKTFIALIIPILFLAISCGDKKENKNWHEENSTVANEESSKVEGPKKLFVWVDQLNVRKEPKLDSDVIIRLSEGAEVLFNNEISELVIEANLRGKKYTGPFYKIKTKSGLEGWIFSPALSENNPNKEQEIIEQIISTTTLIIHEKGIGSWEIKKTDSKERLIELASNYSLEFEPFEGEEKDQKTFKLSRDPLHFISLDCKKINSDSIVVRRVQISDDICPDQYGILVGDSYSDIKKKRKSIKQNTNSKGQTFAYNSSSNIMYEMCCPAPTDVKEEYTDSEVQNWVVTSIFWYPNSLSK